MTATRARSRIVHGYWMPWITLILGTSVVAQADDLHVLKTGLGDGRISGTGISCGIMGATESTDCDELDLAPAASVVLSVTIGPGARFTAWGGDCSRVVVTPPATPTCTVNMNALRRVRANFERVVAVPTIEDFTPEGIRTFLNSNMVIDTPAEFVAALPPGFRQNWILMARSESLQTGIAALPRILLPSADATRVFTLGMFTLGMMPSHSSYPGAHPLAIEYMQWDAGESNFRFHEIVVAPMTTPIPALGGTYDHDMDSDTEPVPRFPARERGVTIDDQKCFACHSTRNVINLNAARAGPGTTPGTTGTTPQTVKFKSKPNWDAYDSWGGMLPFNRDRIYQGSVEAAAFRKLFNLWTWQGNEAVRAVIEQLELQPAGVPNGTTIPRESGVAADHRIRRDVFNGGANDGYVVFGFDPLPFTVAREPNPSGTPAEDHTAYEFNDRVGAGAATNVVKDGAFLTLHHSSAPRSDQGRGVSFFDLLSQGPNPRRIADEMIPKPPLTDHYATGNAPIDVRPFAIAIADGCLRMDDDTGIGAVQTITGLSPALTDALRFFDARNGLSFDGVYDDTRRRAQSLTRRKADIERTTLDRDADVYVYDPAPSDGMPIAPPDRVDGLIRQFGAGTLGIAGGTGGEDRSLTRLRQEVFRRAPPPGHLDETAVGRVYVDREDDSTDPPPDAPRPDNTAKAALYRYFLEPLGISVDKWSMGVRGRSRTYTFADLFGGYSSRISSTLKTSLGLPPGTPCTAPTGTTIMGLVDAQVARLPDDRAIPTFTDVQRIFNKACIECHGGLGYPPYRTYGTSLDFSENEDPSPAAPFPGNRRLGRSYLAASMRISAPTGPPGMEDVSNSYLFRLITDDGLLAHPYDPLEPFDAANPDNLADPDLADERCPEGLMPCEGPPLSKTDIETIKRWIIGGRDSFTEGDPHIRTVEGIHYDFQSAGEFILLRDEGMELQARQTAVTTAGPLPPNPYTGLSSCVSVNTAVAMRVAGNRISYQPEITAGSNDEFATVPADAAKRRRLILRVGGKPVTLGTNGLALSNGGRIVSTSEPGGIEVHFPGGARIVVTPGWWERHRIWYMNIDVRHARAVEGVMGAIAPNNWLPALSTGALLGRQPGDLAQRHRDLYETFADSWRVDAASSLFDYEPGLSPQSFVVEDWPVAETQSCLAPAQPGGPAPAPAPVQIAEAEAEQLCREIVDPERRKNCALDVVATGEAGFAGTYLATDKLERRFLPAPPTLVSPGNNARLTPQAVDFAWAAPPDTGDVNIRYRHCLWNADELYDFNRCLKVGASAGSLLDRIVSVPAKYLPFALCIALLVALILIALLLVVRYRLKGVLVALALAVVLVAILLALDRWHSGGQFKTTVADLEPGKVYFWKVVAETNEGIVIESKTRRFEVTE